MPTMIRSARLYVAALLCCGCAGTPRPSFSPPEGRTRFGQTDDIVVLPEGRETPVALRIERGPQYPPRARLLGGNDSLVVAFVVDSAGSIELPTITLVRPPRNTEFRVSACEFLTRLRFEPPTQRMLVTMPFHFTIDHFIPATGQASPLELSVRSQLRAMSRQTLFSFLDEQPHCR